MMRLFLKRGREESLRRFHPWVFSGAVARCEGQAAEGDVVEVYTHDGAFLATGHYQEGSITVRVLSFRPCTIDAAFWEAALRKARALREAVLSSPVTTAYRLVHGEGDNLPGLVIDIYGNTAVLQAHAIGMFRARHAVVDALRKIYGDQLAAVYDKSTATLPGNRQPPAASSQSAVASQQSAASSDNCIPPTADCILPTADCIPPTADCILPTADCIPPTADCIPPTADCILPTGNYLYRTGDVEQVISENGYRFAVDWENGQKTGFFLDQRDNRQLLSHYAKGRSVLNLFCYTGGFSIYALGGGAAQVHAVDSSRRAIDLANKNVSLNFAGAAPHEAFAADAFDFLHNSASHTYDLMILDPPAFAKHKGALHNALQAYKRLNAAAFSRIAPGGTVFTFSCSQVVNKVDFRNAVFSAAVLSGRPVRILHQLTQPADHPINIYHPEGEYLKGLVLQVE